METFYFGGEPRLFGVLHEPQLDTDGDDAGAPGVVVLCAPLWREAIRAHRVLRQLAIRIASQGGAVLRFDYSGAGDSGGENEHGDVNVWLGDVGAAIDEAKRLRGVDRVSLLGLRFGATLAALAAARRDDVQRLVLWEPVADGSSYVEEGFADHRTWLERYARWRRMPVAAVADPGDEILGFRLTTAMRRSIGAVQLAQLQRAPSHVMVIERAGPGADGGLGAVLAALGARVEHEVLAEPEIWKPHETEVVAGAHRTQEVISSWLRRSVS
jgi:pimeloyl-ACP methyl ester carboxylesterase